MVRATSHRAEWRPGIAKPIGDLTSATCGGCRKLKYETSKLKLYSLLTHVRWRSSPPANYVGSKSKTAPILVREERKSDELECQKDAMPC